MRKVTFALLLLTIMPAATCRAQTPATAPATAPAAAPGGTLKVMALSVGRPGHISDNLGNSWGNWPAGTQVSCLYTDTGRNLIQINEEGSKFTSFTDDQGKNLLEKTESPFGDTGMRMMPNFSPDGHQCQFSLEAQSVPGPKAKAIRIKGYVVAVSGTDVKTETQKDVALTKDTKVKLGQLEATISEVTSDKGFDGQEQTVFTLDSSKPFDTLKELTAQGADGKEVKLTSQVWVSSNMVGPGGVGSSYSRSYGVKGKVDKVSLTAKLYSKVENFKIPVDLTVSVGL